MAEVILGVDTHRDTHTAVLLDEVGRVQATLEVAATEAGYRELLGWAVAHGELSRAGVEATGCYGAGLARHLAGAGIEVIEVNRPNRQRRRLRGKSDPTDAESAARAVLAGEATAAPKARDGIVESIRVLHLTRASCVKSRTQVANQIKDLVVAAPEPIRDELRTCTTRQRVQRILRWRPSPTTADPADATRRALRHLAERYQHLSGELQALDTDLARLVSKAAPNVLAKYGVGIETAAKLLITAGDNPDRFTSEAAFAALCGVSPVEASSGRTRRHRLNRGGDRQANNALWTIAFVRIHREPRSIAYATRRRHQGKNDREILRCLKRYIAREIYPLLRHDLDHARTLLLT